MPRNNTRSSFNGIIHELPEISVDNFNNTTSKAYFLSHCHTDHTSGLFSEALLQHLKKDHVFVYTSKPSAAIVRYESGGNSDIMDYIKPLDVGTTTITFPGNAVTETEDVYLTVSLVPAGHCLGSVMFLFRSLYKTVLYSGDFRIRVNSVPLYAQLHDNSQIVHLDALYVDTTFQSDLHAQFPSRHDSVHQMAQHVKWWLARRDDHRVALHTSARYGYEFVYTHIHKHVGERVCVGDDLWRLYSQFPKSVPGVTNDATSRIHLCRNRTEHKTHERCLPDQLNSGANYKYLYVHFSAMKWTDYQDEDFMVQIKNDLNDCRIDVCFATHCSRSELEYFVNYLSPKKVVGFPNEYIRKHVKINSSTSDKGNIAKNAEKNTDVDKFVDKALIQDIFAD